MDVKASTTTVKTGAKITLGKKKKALPEGAKLVHDSKKLGTLDKGRNEMKRKFKGTKTKVSAHLDLSHAQRSKLGAFA